MYFVFVNHNKCFFVKFFFKFYRQLTNTSCKKKENYILYVSELSLWLFLAGICDKYCNKKL